MRLEDVAAIEERLGRPDEPPPTLEDAMRGAIGAFAAQDDAALRRALQEALRALDGDPRRP